MGFWLLAGSLALAGFLRLYCGREFPFAAARWFIPFGFIYLLPTLLVWEGGYPALAVMLGAGQVATALIWLVVRCRRARLSQRR